MILKNNNNCEFLMISDAIMTVKKKTVKSNRIKLYIVFLSYIKVNHNITVK